MSDFHQTNKIANEKYRRKLFDHFTRLAHPENFSNFKATDPQKFYLDFKNCVAPLINTEIQHLKKSLANTNNSASSFNCSTIRFRPALNLVLLHLQDCVIFSPKVPIVVLCESVQNFINFVDRSSVRIGDSDVGDNVTLVIL